MRDFNFLVCYDIADMKRLRKLAKLLETQAIRIQKSIFFYEKGTKSAIKKLIDDISVLIDHKEDDVRIYKIDINSSISLKNAIDLNTPHIIYEVEI